MENVIVWQVIGFVVCFVLLFVFVAKYREVVSEDTFFEPEGEEAPSVAAVATDADKTRAALLQGNVSPDVADMKDQVRSLHYQLAELRSVTNKSNMDMAKQIARLEQRLGTFEQEYVNKLQPTLLRVIEELEHIKGAEETDSKS